VTDKYIRLYKKEGTCDDAYFLAEGRAIFYLSESDRYGIHGKNLIVGASELIMKHVMKEEVSRIETSVTSSDSQVKKIPAEKFLAGMKTLSFVLNASMVLAKQVKETNRIIGELNRELSGDLVKRRSEAIEFYLIVHRLIEEYDKRKLPWLNDLIKDRITSLMYVRGEAYYKSEQPVTVETGSRALDKNDVEYPRDTVICEEGERGEEMYILKSGSIDVQVGGNHVATIDQPGTVIGEMALLLGETRSATLKAKNNVLISRVSRSDLKDIASRDISILINVATALARRHYYNAVRIESINESLYGKLLDEDKHDSQKPESLDRGRRDLRELKSDVEEAASSHDADFLDDLLETL
jgi:CRP-like cAMP-binding protein